MTTLSTAGPAPASTARPLWREPVAALWVFAVVVTAVTLALQPYRAFGLPAHPLLVHVPVVLIPLVALAVLALAARPAWRLRYGLAVGVAGVVAMGSTILAAGAGEAFRDHGGGGNRVAHHAELGEQLRLIMIVATAALLVWITLDVLRDRGFDNPVTASRTVALFAVVPLALGVVATVWDVRTGHAGAKLVFGNDRGPTGGGGGQFPGGAFPSGGFPGGGAPPAG